MTLLDTAAPAARPSAAALRSAPALFAAALFVSALLLFAVQPMFTKMVLPRLGGSPSVWSVAMVAFETFLFVGYVYAHVLTRALPPRLAAVLHLGFLAVVAASLPLGIAGGFDVPPADGVMIWLVGLFAASIGLPFIALAATAPLLQNWFVATGHPQARNPYVLYAASNLGSFCAPAGLSVSGRAIRDAARAGGIVVCRLCRACCRHLHDGVPGRPSGRSVLRRGADCGAVRRLPTAPRRGRSGPH